MDTDQPTNDESVAPPARFIANTRADLKKQFVKARAKASPTLTTAEIELDGNIFVGTLESYGRGIPSFVAIKPPEQKRRREKVRSLAATLERLHQVLTEIDSDALNFAVWMGRQEVGRKALPVYILPNEMGPDFYADCVRNPSLFRNMLSVKTTGMALPTLAAFSTGVRAACKALPAHEYNFMLQTALAVERTFYENGLTFTISNSGFAAECLRAIFQLGGLRDIRVDYWLKRARDSESSMGALLKRQAARQKSDDE